MRSLKYYLVENNMVQMPMQILMRGNIGLTSKEEDFTKEAMKRLYEKYIRLVLIKKESEYNRDSDVPENRKNEIDFSYPILNFTSTENDFIKDDKATVFNKMEDYPISADKKVFQQELGETCSCIPKAVYSLDDIEELKLPIIAKPADGFSAQGIEKFDTYEDARNSDLEFDIWCECKDLDREFRAFIMNGEILLIAERITNTENDKSVGKKDADEKIDLVYIDQDMDKFPHLERIKEIQKELEAKVNLDFYNIDLMLDKDGELWVPEINGAPGIGPSHFKTLYKKWLEMAYDTEMSEDVDKELTDIEVSHRENMKKEYPNEYEFSLAPKK